MARPATVGSSLLLAALAVTLSAGTAATARSGSGTPTTPRTAAAAAARPLAGTHCPVFPGDDVWHASVRHLPVQRRSAQWVRHIGDVDLHPDFGPSLGAAPVPYGIPITVVGAHHRTVHVSFGYSAESDHRPYPLGADTKIEGGRHADGDRHAVVVDRQTCRLYETFATDHRGGRWSAGSGATWSLRSDRLRPRTWTSADAAGLPILPGLLRLDEVEAGHVDHAIRFTAPTTATRFLWPARHEAGSTSSRAYPPMGARFRLRASYPTKGLRRDTRAVIQAMKTYGLILADNGPPWFFGGESVEGWPNAMLDQLKAVPSRDFVAVDESSLRRSSGSGAVR